MWTLRDIHINAHHAYTDVYNTHTHTWMRTHMSIHTNAHRLSHVHIIIQTLGGEADRRRLSH